MTKGSNGHTTESGSKGDRIPAHIQALLSAMRFRGASSEGLRSLDDSQWSDLLSFSDTMHLTLYAGRVLGESPPKWVKRRIAQNYIDNQRRQQAAAATYSEIARSLDQAGIEHLVLKGFARWPCDTWDLSLHMQSDIDLYCPPGQVAQALERICALGYEPARGMEGVVTDHLPTLQRLGNWQWRGYLFDPEMPLSVDLHFRLWDREGLHFGPHDLDDFWRRRVSRRAYGMEFNGLHPVDLLAYSCLHILRHLFRGGDLLTVHVYELAFLLHLLARDTQFWQRWAEWQPISVRRAAAACFQLARRWFACDLHEVATADAELLGNGVNFWLEHEADSTLTIFSRQHKNAMWLHLSLVDSFKDRMLTFRENLFPARMPSLDAPYVQGRENGTHSSAAVRRSRHLAYVVRRSTYHASLIPSTLWQGAHWLRALRSRS